MSTLQKFLYRNKRFVGKVLHKRKMVEKSKEVERKNKELLGNFLKPRHSNFTAGCCLDDGSFDFQCSTCDFVWHKKCFLRALPGFPTYQEEPDEGKENFCFICYSREKLLCS